MLQYFDGYPEVDDLPLAYGYDLYLYPTPRGEDANTFRKRLTRVIASIWEKAIEEVDRNNGLGLARRYLQLFREKVGNRGEPALAEENTSKPVADRLWQELRETSRGGIFYRDANGQEVCCGQVSPSVSHGERT